MDKEIERKLAEEAELFEEANEEEEQAFVKPRPPRSGSQVYSIRIPTDRLEELRRMARTRHLPPATMIRQWVLERLDSEAGFGDAVVSIVFGDSVIDARDVQDAVWERELSARTSEGCFRR